MRTGVETYFDQVNKGGGVHGRKLVLKSLDDGYEATRAAANTKTLITQEGVFALLGYVGTPTSEAAKPIFTQAKVPFVGAFTGAELLRTPFNRYIFNVRASYYNETDAIVNLLAYLGFTRIAVFYQNDSYGKAGLAGVELAMTKRNMKIAATGTVERNTTEVAAAVTEIAKIDPQAVVMISAYKSCAAFINAMKKANSNPQFMNVSFVGSKALATELGEAGRGVGISQVVPFPWSLSAPVVKEYQKHFVAHSRERQLQFLEPGGLHRRQGVRRRIAPRRPAADPRRIHHGAGDTARLRRWRIQGHLYADRPQWLEVRRTDRHWSRWQVSSLTRDSGGSGMVRPAPPLVATVAFNRIPAGAGNLRSLSLPWRG